MTPNAWFSLTIQLASAAYLFAGLAILVSIVRGGVA